MQLKMAYLIMASVAVAIIALLYGISPTWYASTFLGITSLNPNIAHILRAVTGLSFGFSCAEPNHSTTRERQQPVALRNFACGEHAVLVGSGSQPEVAVWLLCQLSPAADIAAYQAMSEKVPRATLMRCTVVIASLEA
jgi:hypothetical protein